MLSIAHRPAVARFHDRVLRVEDRQLVEKTNTERS
jgi:hypothetical protein